jgi:hypothetical protein
MAIAAFRKIQIGQESTSGTEVNADVVLHGTLTITPEQTLHQPVDERGSLAQHFRDTPISHMTRLRYQGDATYEQIMHFMVMALDVEVISVPTNGSKTKDLTVTPSLVAANVQDSYTFEFGDEVSGGSFTVPYVQATSVELGISMGGPVSLSAELFGHMALQKAKTASLASPVVNEILSDGARFYIDTTFANLGTTQKNAMLVGGTIRLNSGLAPVKYADGTAATAVLDDGDTVEVSNFSATREVKRSHSMDLDFIATTDFYAQVYNAYIRRTNRAIRLTFLQTGVDHRIEAVSPDYYRNFTIDMFGRFTSAPEIFGERDGEDMIRVTFTSYDDGLTSGVDSGGNELKVTTRLSTDEVSGGTL